MSDTSQDSVTSAKKYFNQFFKKELYGTFKSEVNLILSRGSWNENSIRFPKFFKTCIDISLEKHWTGYSDSLGHRYAVSALRKLLSSHCNYSEDQIALTLGNSVTIGIVFQQLSRQLVGAKVLTLTPYYPPILRSIHNHFPDTVFISSLGEENDIIAEIRKSVLDNRVKILFLTNFIGVEGRIFSERYWKEILQISKEFNLFLIIDEGLAFTETNYPREINQENVVRIVSVSKKYGVPGMKFGFILADKVFMENFYESASTNYGGPSSLLFLLSEFLYLFEYILKSGGDAENEFRELSRKYSLSEDEIAALFSDYKSVVELNERHFSENLQAVRDWYRKNSNLFEQIFDFGGINILFKPDISCSCHELFLRAIRGYNVSVLPGKCLGDTSDTLFRVTLLEQKGDQEEALERLSKIIRENTKE
ncbi:MAG: pyridoxal phosphate-dependent aminotransferase [Patescibacteria group bacterium]